MKIVDDPRFVEKEQYRSLLALHYFGYLRRNPDDPPDGDLRGFNFWLQDLERHHDVSRLSLAFKVTGEYRTSSKKSRDRRANLKSPGDVRHYRSGWVRMLNVLRTFSLQELRWAIRSQSLPVQSKIVSWNFHL